jgi:hypothetical protein
MIVLRKNLTVKQGEEVLFDDIKYFFYITNRYDLSKELPNNNLPDSGLFLRMYFVVPIAMEFCIAFDINLLKFLIGYLAPLLVFLSV